MISAGSTFVTTLPNWVQKYLAKASAPTSVLARAAAGMPATAGGTALVVVGTVLVWLVVVTGGVEVVAVLVIVVVTGGVVLG